MLKAVWVILVFLFNWLTSRNSPQAKFEKLEKEIQNVKNQLMDELEKNTPNECVVNTLTDRLQSLIRQKDSLCIGN